MKPCNICNINKRDLLVIYESENWIVTLATDQTYLGRSYITLKRHSESLSDVTTEEWSDLHNTITKIETAIKNGFGADLFNWSCLMNDAFHNNDAPSPHVHWHMRPRYAKPAIINKITFIDNEFGRHYKTKWDGKDDFTVDQETMLYIKQKIIDNL